MAVNSLMCILRHISFVQSAGCQQFTAIPLGKNAGTISLRKCSSSGDQRLIVSAKQHVNGLDFHYEQTGHGKHTVLLIPGALGCSRTDFQPQLSGLNTNKYRIIALDPRGYGKSCHPVRDWPLKFYQRDADDAAAFMKALEIPRYSILGWSDGGIVGMILAARNQANVHRLVIWGASSYISDFDLELLKNVANIDQWSTKMKQPFIDVYGEVYFRQLWDGWNTAIENLITQKNRDVCTDSLPDIKCPTLIVNGLKDAMISQEHPAFLQKNITNSRTVDFPEGKHNLHLRYHKEFNTLVEEFLDEDLQLKH